jgi:hypothetical protein
VTRQPRHLKRRTPLGGGVSPSALRWAPRAARRAVRHETPIAWIRLKSTPSYRVPGYGFTTGSQDRVVASTALAAPTQATAHSAAGRTNLFLPKTDRMTQPFETSQHWKDMPPHSRAASGADRRSTTSGPCSALLYGARRSSAQTLIRGSAHSRFDRERRRASATVKPQTAHHRGHPRSRVIWRVSSGDTLCAPVAVGHVHRDHDPPEESQRGKRVP